MFSGFELRVLGGVMVAVGGAVWGGFAARQQKKRVRALEGFCGALEVMERELSMRLTPTPELLAQVKRHVHQPLQDFFEQCEQAVRLGQSISGVWEEGLLELELFDEQSIHMLKPLGGIIGRYDALGQQQAIGAVRQELELHCHSVKEKSDGLCRVYRALGATVGAFVVILLL